MNIDENYLAFELYINENLYISSYNSFILDWDLSDPYIKRAKNIIRKRKIKILFHNE